MGRFSFRLRIPCRDGEWLVEQKDCRSLTDGQPIRYSPLRDQYFRAAIAEHERQSLGRVARIEWYVRCSNAEHGEYGNGNVGGSLQSDANSVVRRHPQYEQMAD
jgi:hypothetical protein